MLSPTPPAINRPSLHPGAGYFIGPRVPHGLAAVVEGLTREVLRHRPEDIYVFAAHHFEKLLKLREQYHAEKYRNIREFDDDFRDFNLWPTKEPGETRVSPTSGWPLDKEIKAFERRGKVSTDVEESPEDVSTDREKRKASRQTCTKSSSSAKRASRRSTKDKDAASDSRATKIISQMSALRGSSRTILTKDIKQELRKNKLNSGEKGKLSDSVEKGIRGERRSRTKVSKTDKNAEEEIERAATTTTGKTSARRPLKKVRRIETESETETEREIASKDRLGNGYERTSVKGDSANREAATACSRSRRSEAAAWPCEHSSERKVSSRALSMDRIRAYVLRKFASTASLEVLRSPTYVEEVQEVIDRAAPIIKEKLEEIRKPRGKRSRSVDFAWNEESFRRCVAKDSRRCGDRDEEEKGKRKSSGNGALEQEFNDARREDKSENQSARREEVASSAESEERRPGRRSAGSGRRSRRRENGGHGDLGLADRVDDDSEHSNKSEQESGAGRDTLEARLTATQSILEGISMSASELSGARKVDSADDERGEPTLPSEASDHVNVVSLPIVRPPSSKSCRNAAKNGSDSLTLPPISPEAPRSTKKKDELSLPILPNGNQSAKKSQEQDGSKDAEEASTMRDITSDMEDIAVLPEDEGEQLATADARQDLMSDHQDLMSDARPGEEDEDIEEEALWKDTPRELAGKRISDVSLDQDLKEYQKLTEAEERRAEEVYKDSLNVTPEVADLPLRPDSLESGEEERDKLQDEDADGDVVRNQTFDDLKDRLIEIEMAERNIEKALAGQQTATCNDEAMSEAGRSTSVEKMDEARKSSGEAEKVASEIGESTSEQGTPNEERKSMNEEEKEEEESVNGVQEGSSNTERLTNERGVLSEEGESLNEEEKEGSANEAEPSTMIGNEELTEEKGSEAQVGISINEAERVLNGVEELMVKRHMKNLESTNTQYKIKNGQIVEVSVHGVDDKDDATASNGKSVTAGAQTTGSGNATDEQHLTVSPPTSGNGIGKTKARKRRETNEIPATTPLSLKIPFAYVLSEGSPCEIPDSVTTVIIPDRPCPSPVISEIDDRQPGLTYFPIERAAHDYVVEDVSSKDETRQNEGHAEYDMEVFGEYIHPEVALPVDIDFVHGARGVKPSQDIMIVHQDLDRIKEEGEEEEEDKEDGERKGEEESCLEKDNGDGEAVETAVGQAEEIVKLEDIVEHEEDETNARTIAEKIPSSCVPESEALPETTESTDLTNAGKTDVAGESRSTSDNLSEVNGSSQDVHTTTSSDAKESTASNQSIESSSIGRPIVPELNLDSLQDNTVSSFKMTANGTATKESNGSPRESDATMSLVEPLTPDERLTMGNRLMLAERELETPVEELALGSLNFRAQSDMPEADQLYPAEHAEYELLEKDLLSSEAVLEDEAREEDVIASVSREKREAEELDSEEEIARELISFLNNDTQLFVRESDRGRKLEDYEKPIKSNLDVDDGTNRPLSDFVHSISVDQAEKEKGDVLSEQSGKLGDEDVSKTEAVSELSGHIVDSSQENEDEDEVMVNKETEDPELEVEQKEHVENNQVASLVESQQDEFSAKDNAVTNEETEEPKEVKEEEHLKSSQVTPLAKSERDESSVKDNAAINEESEEPKVEVEEEEHIKSSQATSLAESERDESSVKDNTAINEESEEPKVEVEEEEHIKSSQATSLAESERDESSVKDNAAINEESEEPKVEIEEEEEHIKSSQVTPLAESEQDESSVKDNAAINEESEEPKVEVEEEEHIKSSQVTSLESERDESSVKDNAAINEESEEPKVEVEEEEHIKSSQVTSLAESEQDESSVKDNAAINEESEEPKVEVEEEEEHIKSSQVTPLAESEQDESSTKDNATTNEETEESKVEIEDKEHIESSQVISLAESEQESSAKDNAATNEEIEESEVEVEEKKHIETNQIAPLAEFEPDELLEKNGSHEMSDEKITDERDADIAGDQESREDKQIDESILKSQSSESASKIEEFHEKQEEDKHEEWKDQGKSEEENVMAQEECQEEELNDEGKREREESIANEEDGKEHIEVQETMKSREDVPKTSTEESEDAGQDETPLTESITDDTATRDVTNEKEETDDLSAKLESVHGPITSAISTQDHHYARYWTMGTKSSTAETVIAAFGSNTSADEKSLDDSREKDDFYSAVVKSQACVRGFLTRRRLRRDLGSDSVSNDVPLTRATAIARNVFMPEDRSSLREARSGRHRLRREEALRKTTLSLENAFATGRLQHTGEFHDSVPLPLFDITHSETNSSDSLDESLAEEEPTKTDTAKSSTCETANSNCHDNERRGCPRKSNAFAGHSELPIVMQLLAGASRNFRINRNSDPDLNLRGHGAKLVEPALDILMLGYPRDEATLQNRYLNFITSVEDIGSNMDYPDVAMSSATNADDAQPSGEASMPGSLREPLALPGSPQGVVIEELTSLDETAGDVSLSTATKTSLDTNSSVPPKECTLEDKNNSEASPRTNPADKDTIISDQKSTTEEAGESGDKSAVDRNSPKIGLHAEDTSGSSSAIFHDSNGHEGEDGKT